MAFSGKFVGRPMFRFWGARLGCAAGLFLAAMGWWPVATTSNLINSVNTELAAPSAAHVPVFLRLLPDGSFARGAQNQIINNKWSGYVIRTADTGTNYWTAKATWIVPGVSYSP